MNMRILVDEPVDRTIAANDPGFGDTIPLLWPVGGKNGMSYVHAREQYRNLVSNIQCPRIGSGWIANKGDMFLCIHEEQNTRNKLEVESAACVVEPHRSIGT